MSLSLGLERTELQYVRHGQPAVAGLGDGTQDCASASKRSIGIGLPNR